MNNNLEAEASAFDRQIQDRIDNGHIPDLRYSKYCSYFYNNSWRQPSYVKLDFGEIFDLINGTINKYFKEQKEVRILEVGCGPGYLSLELSRNGYNVTGLDISKKCIEIAEHFASLDPHKNNRGILNYICNCIEDQEFQDDFDVIIFLGSLHHFKDQNAILKKCNDLLTPEGLLIAHEPTRDRISKGNAAFHLFLKALLSVNNGYYKETSIETLLLDPMAAVDREYSNLKYLNENGENEQSINDNEAGFLEMYSALKEIFIEKDFKERYSFFHEVIGGLRFDDEINLKMALFLREFDRLFCQYGVLQPTEFYFVGQKK